MTAGDINFVTFDHTRHKLLTSEQMRDTERRAIAAGAVTGISMMETAGCGVVAALLEASPVYANGSHRAVVLCGPGNNGGDGFVIARALHALDWEVDLYLLGNVDKLPPDAAENARRWQTIGTIKLFAELKDAQAETSNVVFDALFGTGLVRPLSAELLDVLERVARLAKTIVAVDISSGVSADTGHLLRSEPLSSVESNQQRTYWPRADHIVTFQRMKPGHIFAFDAHPNEVIGNDSARTLSIIDLGIEAFEPPSPRAQGSGGGDSAIVMGGAPLALQKENRGHKYQHGHALVCAGGVGKGGAARLAALAALRVGAGAVTLACPPNAMVENAAQLNAVMLTSVSELAEFEALLVDRRKNVLCLGPGMGVDQRSRSLVIAALKTGRPMVLDADALTNFAETPDMLFAELHNQVVLTPHTGEFSRLFPDLSASYQTSRFVGNVILQLSRIDAARAAARRANCHILLKGAVTVIAAPTGKIELSVALGERASPWLATAGAGDVLAGFITGLMARGFEPFRAATTAAWLHIECARAFGPGLIAEDLPDMLPRVLSQWEDDLKAGRFAQ